MNTADILPIIDSIGPGFTEGAAERDETDAFVGDHYPVLRAEGLTRMLVPRELGGLGASHPAACAALRRLGYYDGSTALALSMHTHAVGTLTFKHRRGDAAATASLRRVVEDDLVMLSTGGRDWLESNGMMTRTDGGFRVSAKKAFASGAPAADVAVTSAPYRDPEAGWQVLHFAVPLDRDGVTLDDDWIAHGMRSTGSHTIRLEDVFVPDDAITLRRPRDGFAPMWNVVLGVALPLIFAPYVGVAERAVEAARSLAGRRAEDVTVQWAAGEMQSALVVARTCHDRMVALADDLSFEPSIELSSELLALESAVVDAVRDATDAALETAGGVGFFRRTGLERLVRDVRAGHYHPLPRKRQRLFSGRIALGLPPSSPG